jgi:DNA-binding MarR family transcriptional regulator
MPSQPNESHRLTFFVKAAELTQRVATAPILERYGLTYAQLAMLLSISRVPGASSAALARMHGITAQSSGEVIGVLEKRGLIARRADEANARILRLMLTREGQQMFEEAQAMLDEIDRELTAEIDAIELETTRRVLAIIISRGNRIPIKTV